MRSVQISVIVPLRNYQAFIGRCIRSLLKQSIDETEYEIIVINDCSTDRSHDVIMPFMGDIKYFKNKKKMGLSASLNIGIKNARGQFVVRVDADDFVHKDYLKILSMHLHMNNNIQAIACDYYLVDNLQNIISHENCLENPIGCGIMFRINKLIEIGLYNEDFLAREEEELKIRFEKKYEIHRLQLPLYKYRRHDSNLTNDKLKMESFGNKLTKEYGKK